ncbi:MAG: hypothetical protein JNL11_17895 [Bdellovibrionaceae bacterium]|nr:hypothetical protein [Pseudobdellovibrionaceae bacterium]
MKISTFYFYAFVFAFQFLGMNAVAISFSQTMPSQGICPDNSIAKGNQCVPIKTDNGDVQTGGASCTCSNGSPCILFGTANAAIERVGIEEVKNMNQQNSNGEDLYCVTEKTAASGQENKSVDSGACYAQFQELHRKCTLNTTEATSSCDQDNDTIQQAMQATKAVGVGAVALNQACSKLADISKIANTALAGWQSMCAASRNTCESYCTQARQKFYEPGCIPDDKKQITLQAEMVEIKENINKCMSFKQRVAEASQHAMTALVQMQAAKNCKTDTDSGLTANNVDACKTDPNSAACKDLQRCSNAAYAASNPVCQCMNTPNAKECVAAYTNADASRNVATVGVTSSGDGSSAEGGGLNGINAGGGAAGGADPYGTLTNSLRDSAYQSGSGQNLGGQKGNAGLGGGGGGGSMGGGSGGSAAGGPLADPSEKTKVNSGTYGAAPGGAGMAGGYFRNNAATTSSFNRNSNTGGVNYEKLHGAQFDPKRYIVGMNGKEGELVNGPNSFIFKIVKTRLEVKSPSMLDPDFKK